MQEDTWTSSSEKLLLSTELGESIRGYRTDAGLEISDLAVRTRIGARNLSALEEGNWKDLPGPVFVKGFIRSICKELGREPEPLLKIVDEIHAEPPREELDSANGTRRVTPLILSGILLAGLITGGILLHGGKEEGTQVAVQPVTDQNEPSVSTGEEFSEEDSMVELDLLLRATDKTWLRIQADSSEPWETTMKTGDEIRLKAVERVTLFIGNAGGILFELNGRRFGPLGKQGQVISSYVITRDNL